MMEDNTVNKGDKVILSLENYHKLLNKITDLEEAIKRSALMIIHGSIHSRYSWYETENEAYKDIVEHLNEKQTIINKLTREIEEYKENCKKKGKWKMK